MPDFHDRRTGEVIPLPVKDTRSREDRYEDTRRGNICYTCESNKLTRPHEIADGQCSECTADQAYEMAENNPGRNSPAETPEEWQNLAEQGHIRVNINTGRLAIPKMEELLQRDQ